MILQTLDEAIRVAKDLEKNNSGWVYVPPFDDPLIWYVEPPTRVGSDHASTSVSGHLPQYTPSHSSVHVCAHHIEAHTQARLLVPTSVCVSARSPGPWANAWAQIHRGVCVCVIGAPGSRTEKNISEKAVDLGGDSFEYWGSKMRKGGC